MIRFEGEFELSLPGAPARLLNGSGGWDQLVPVFALRHQRVKSVVATEAGELSVEFENGSTLRAGSHEKYESWEVAADDALIVALPGSGVAVWGSTNRSDDPAAG